MAVQQNGTNGFSARQVFYKTSIVLLTLLGAYLLYRFGTTILILFVAIIVASAIRPLVDAQVRHSVPRGLAILLVYLALIGGFVVLLVLTLPPLVRMTIELVSNGLLIEQLNALLSKLVMFGWDQFRVILPVFELPEQVQTLLERTYATMQGQAWVLAQDTLTVLGRLVLALVMGFYWLTSREQMLNLLLRTSPSRSRPLVEDIWNDIEGTLGAYVRGQVTLMLAVGFAAFAGLVVLRVPYALALGVLAGLTEAIPMVGPFLGGIPAVLIALTVSPVTGLLVAGWYFLVQQLENHLLVPKVMQGNVGLNPLVVILAITAGVTLNGFLGALLAVPVAGALQVIARHLLIEPALRNSAPRTEKGLLLLGEEEPEPPVVPPIRSSAEGPAGPG